MTDDQHGEGTPRGGGRWDPLPQGDYDDGATAFVELPEGGVDALLDSLESPLAAPGHGYVPPQITVAPATGAGTDPAAMGTWPAPGAPGAGAQWHDPQAGPPRQEPGADAAPQHAGQDDRFTYPPGPSGPSGSPGAPGAAGQWGFEGAPAAQDPAQGHPAPNHPAPGQDVTGQWSIPVAGGDLPDESGEFTTSALAEQWGGTPPATLPGGASAPWADQAIGQPWGPGVPGVPQEQQGGEPGPVRQDTAGQADAGPGSEDREAGPERHRAPQERQEGGPRPHDDPGRDAFASERPAGEHAPGQPEAGHAPGQPAHAGPRSSGTPQPFATEGYAEPAAEPQWRSGAEAYPGAQDDPRPASGPEGTPEAAEAPRAAHGAQEAAHGAPEAADGAAQERTEPSAAGPGPAAGGAPEPAAADAPAADAAAPGTATAQAAPDPAGSPDAVNTPDASGPPGAPSAPGDPAPPAAPAPDGSAPPHDPPPDAPHEDHPLASYVLRVNGSDRPVTDAWIGESLLYVLRERLGLAGAKDGCSQGECGACNVQVDGRLVASCLVPAVTAAGSEVRTVEGLAQDGRPSDVQRALARCGAVQCGFCIPGMAMTVHDLLEGNPAPTELETRQALCGNLCRCSGYRGVVDAVKEVVAEREAHAAAPEADPDADTDPDVPRIPHQAGPGAGGVNPSVFGSTGPHDQSHGQDGGQA
ncbi:2Fe-2S iron-sulfur cluster-binding protein [Streptomyces viridosporus]|uniref:2Fe-2S iron-sulfur cluster-binding protein n=1 Tax=Streptomyces viridosporus TaxID=67581 RepID=UPI0036FD6997